MNLGSSALSDNGVTYEEHAPAVSAERLEVLSPTASPHVSSNLSQTVYRQRSQLKVHNTGKIRLSSFFIY
jgi:hypothetical protein